MAKPDQVRMLVNSHFTGSVTKKEHHLEIGEACNFEEVKTLVENQDYARGRYQKSSLGKLGLVDLAQLAKVHNVRIPKYGSEDTIRRQIEEDLLKVRF